MPVRTEVLMGTFVTIEVCDTRGARREDEAIARAFGWFHAVERCCTRFEEDSELMRLSARPGVAVRVSEILLEAVRFAVAVADDTGGAFDPTVGGRMAARGFDREHRSGRRVAAVASEPDASYRDVVVDPDRHTITLRRPLTLDLGGVAKGLAIDAAARELRPFRDFAIDAGGDLFLGGHSARGEPWAIGIRHPRADGEVVETLRVSNAAVCTSGDYERRIPSKGGEYESHLVDPRTGGSATAAASVTVIAPNAMLADALATAAFVLGPDEGLAMLERNGVDGLIFTPDLRRLATAGFPRG